jgi:hypothetical protein
MLLLAPRDAAGSTARGDVPAQDDQQEPSAGPLLLEERDSLQRPVFAPLAVGLDDQRQRRTGRSCPESALSHRGLLFRFALSVTSDAMGMVPTGRRADSH